MKTTIFQAAVPTPSRDRLCHDKAGVARVIRVQEAAVPIGPIRCKTASVANGYKLPPAERAHRNRKRRLAKRARGHKP